MNDEHKRRARAAEIRREVQKRRAARATGFHGKKIAEDSFEQVKVKMVMRIYGVSCEQAKEIIAGRAAEKASLKAANKAKPERNIRKPRCRVRDEDDEWIPASEIFSDVRD